MRTASELLRELWMAAGGKSDALNNVALTGCDPVLPSSFRIGAAAQVSIAAAGLAAAEIWRHRTGAKQSVAVEMRDAAVEFRSERYLRVIGQEPPPAWDPLAGVYRTGGSEGYVRLHTNFPHHRQAILDVLACGPTRDEVQVKLQSWDAAAFETAAYAAGGVVAALRSPQQWANHPQAEAIAPLPVITIERIGDAAPRPIGRGNRPLSGIRVLDLSRVIAGPVAGRALAGHGADVLAVAGPDLPTIPWLVIDTGRGKRSAHVDLKTQAGQATLRRLLADTDIFSQGYRPESLANLGFSSAAVAAMRPGIVYVSLSAYGHAGPWANHRGFDSLVQTATGINHAEAAAAGIAGPKELPAQALDHASGYLMAFGAMMARLRQAQDGGSWHVRVSLAQTGRWLADMGRIENGSSYPDPTLGDIGSLLEEHSSGFGRIRCVRHAAQLSVTPARWERPSVPLGTDAAIWPDGGASA